MRWVIVGMYLLLACTSVTEPSGEVYSYSSTIDGAEVSGTITVLDNPGFHLSGSYRLDGETGEIEGSVTGGEMQFLVIGFRGDTLRHIAEQGDTLRGQWERGTVVSGSWSGTGETGTFTALR